MKKKVFSNTYLKEADKYQIKFYLDEDDKYISIKKLVHLTEYFYIANNVLAMGDGFYVMEIISKEEYELTLNVKDKLLEEIKNGTNKLLNLNHQKYLEDF